MTTLPNHWRVVRFRDVLAMGVRNGIYKPAEFHGRGAKIVNMGELFGHPRLRAVPMRRIDVDEGEFARFGLEEMDLLFARRSLVAEGAGKCSIVLEIDDRTVFESSIIRARVDTEEASPLFLYYLWSSPVGAHLLDTIRRQVAVAGITGKDLEQLQIPLPPCNEQRAIASVLGALDDKIEQNRRTAQALEKLARAIFRAWFVDFEPVKAKAAGATRFPSMPQPVFDALPTRFVDSAIGPVPEGWDVKVATKLATVGIGKTPPRKEPQWFSQDRADVRWASIKDMGQAGVFIAQTSEYLTEDAVEKCRVRRIPDRSVLFSFKLTVGRVAITDGEMTSNEAIAHFIPNDVDTVGAEYLYCYLSNFDHASLGSTSSIATATNSKVVKAMPVLAPTDLFAGAFTSKVRPLFGLLRQLSQQSRKLAELRDYLLPKLLSGDIRVGEAERTAATVA